MAQVAIPTDVLHHITMKLVYHRYIYNQVLPPCEVDMFDKEVGASFPITGGDIFDLRRITGPLTDGLQRFQQDPMTVSAVLSVLLA